MKLSEKGAKKVFEHAMWGDGYYDLEDAISVNLEPDDFEGAVVLTIEEAKELALKLMSNDEFFFRQTGEFDYYTDAWYQYLTDKIEQAENCDGKA